MSFIETAWWLLPPQSVEQQKKEKRKKGVGWGGVGVGALAVSFWWHCIAFWCQLPLSHVKNQCSIYPLPPSPLPPPGSPSPINLSWDKSDKQRCKRILFFVSARVRLSIVTIRYRTRLSSIVTIQYRTRLSSSPCSRARINGCMLPRVDKGNKAYSQRNAYLQRYLLTERGMFLEDNYGNKCAPVFGVITLTIFRRVTLFCRHFFAVRVSLVQKK